MKELNRTDRLTIATVAFAFILVTGLLTLKKPDVQFTRTPGETVKLIATSNDIILPEEIHSILKQADDKYFLIDVRSPVDYQKSHLANAINIPAQEILLRQNLKTFSKLSEEGVTIILYGKDQLEANGAWMILKQIGLDNIRVMMGGFDYYSKAEAKISGLAKVQDYQVEKPRVDFKTVLTSFGASVAVPATEVAEPVKIIKKAKKSATEGGC